MNLVKKGMSTKIYNNLQTHPQLTGMLKYIINSGLPFLGFKKTINRFIQVLSSCSRVSAVINPIKTVDQEKRLAQDFLAN